jgi:hypothetical protein
MTIAAYASATLSMASLQLRRLCCLPNLAGRDQTIEPV